MPDKSMWDILDEQESKESGGGGAIYGLVNFETGYKLFLSGLTQEEDFFACNFADKDASEKAKATAQALLDSKGIKDKRPQAVVQFRVYKDQVLGREVNWKGDRFFSYPLWTDDYKQQVKVALKATLITTTGKYWMKMIFKKTVTDQVEPDANGEPRAKLICFPEEAYESKEKCAAAAGTSGVTAAAAAGKVEGVPAGYDAATWDAIKAELAADAKKRLGTVKAPAAVEKILAGVASDYGVTLDDVKGLLA